jgi:predicted nucleotidyltransferase component of viral defense system
MLTRSQIQRLAQRQRIGVQAQERDYIQHVLLFSLYNRSQAFVFKGGTALRIVYRSNRFSEDLDFNSPANTQTNQSIWASILKDLQAFGITAEIRNSWLSEIGYSFDVSFQGPLFDGRDRTKGKVRVDMSLRQEVVASNRELVNPSYDDLQPFVINVLTAEHLLAEKVRALLVRGKPRDVYDIWLLMHQDVRLDRKLVDEKLSLYNLKLTEERFHQAMEEARSGWERDLRPLLPQFLPWGDIEAKVKTLLSS